MPKQRRSTYQWYNWTVHIGGQVIGTWPHLVEAKYEAQRYHDGLTEPQGGKVPY